jgi:hypothetical protein
MLSSSTALRKPTKGLHEGTMNKEEKEQEAMLFF